MVDARRLAEWDRTACIAATILSSTSRKAINPIDLNPYRSKLKPAELTDDIDILDAFFF